MIDANILISIVGIFITVLSVVITIAAMFNGTKRLIKEMSDNQVKNHTEVMKAFSNMSDNLRYIADLIKSSS